MGYRKLWWLGLFLAVSCSKPEVLQKSANTTFKGGTEDWAVTVDKYRAAFDAWWAAKSKASGTDSATPPLYDNLQVCHDDASTEPLLDAPVGFQAGNHSMLKETIDQVAADPGSKFTDPETRAWYDSGGVTAPQSYTALDDSAIPQCPVNPATVRRVGPVVGGIPGACAPPSFPCHLTGPGVPRSPGCCVRCFAPFCYAVYANGVQCAGRNIVPWRWGWCSGRPAGQILAWSCPCR